MPSARLVYDELNPSRKSSTSSYGILVIGPAFIMQEAPEFPQFPANLGGWPPSIVSSAAERSPNPGAELTRGHLPLDWTKSEDDGSKHKAIDQ